MSPFRKPLHTTSHGTSHTAIHETSHTAIHELPVNYDVGSAMYMHKPYTKLIELPSECVQSELLAWIPSELTSYAHANGSQAPPAHINTYPTFLPSVPDPNASHADVLYNLQDVSYGEYPLTIAGFSPVEIGAYTYTGQAFALTSTQSHTPSSQLAINTSRISPSSPTDGDICHQPDRALGIQVPTLRCHQDVSPPAYFQTQYDQVEPCFQQQQEQQHSINTNNQIFTSPSIGLDSSATGLDIDPNHSELVYSKYSPVRDMNTDGGYAFIPQVTVSVHLMDAVGGNTGGNGGVDWSRQENDIAQHHQASPTDIAETYCKDWISSHSSETASDPSSQEQSVSSTHRPKPNPRRKRKSKPVSPRRAKAVFSHLICEHCGKKYSGQYAKGNLTRHKKQDHPPVSFNLTVHPQELICRRCPSVYRRTDARRKHEWKKHRIPEAMPKKRGQDTDLSSLDSYDLDAA